MSLKHASRHGTGERRRTVVLVLVLALASSLMPGRVCGGGSVLFAQEAGGARVRVKPSTNRMRVTETLRIGSVVGDGAGRFSRITGLAVSPGRGEVFVLDGLERSVSVFDTTGQFLRSWGREGGGPGEFQSQVVAIAVARDTVLVAAVLKIHTFDVQGTFLDSFAPRTDLVVTAPFGLWATNAGWRVGMQEVEPGVTGSWPHRRYYVLMPALKTLARPWVFQLPRPGGVVSDPLAHTPLAAVSYGGSMVSALSAAYELQWTGVEGTIERTVDYDVRPVRYPRGVRQAQAEAILAECRARRAPQMCPPQVRDLIDELRKTSPPPSRPAVESLVVGRERILVGRGDLDDTAHVRGDGTEFDLLDGRGEPLGRLALPPRFKPMWLDEASIWGVSLDAFDVPFVVRLGYGN